MKTLTMIACLVFTGMLARAQGSNLILFSQGEKFTLYVNGARINSMPDTNVKATDISADFVKVRVVFDDGRTPELSKGIMIYDETTPPPVEVTYQIKANKKGSYGIQHVSTSNLTVASTPVVSSTVVTSSVPVVTSTVTTTETQSVTTNNNVSMNVGSSSGDKASLNMSVKDPTGNDVSFNMSINVNDASNNKKQTSNSSTTVTTTQTVYSAPATTTTATATSSGCAPMNQNNFQQLVSSIDDQASEENRLSIAMEGADDACLSTKQVINILGLFASEENRLKFAKYAYLRTADRDKYHTVNSALYSDDSVKQLTDYIKSTR